MKVTTESGAVYEFAGEWVRRIPAEGSSTLRADGGWLRLLSPPSVIVGRGMQLRIASIEPGVAETLRLTTPVVNVEAREYA